MQLVNSSSRELFKSFRRKLAVNFEKGNYAIRTVESGAELEAVFKLRYRIFFREFQNRKYPFGLDIDAFDASADHLVIVDKREGRIVGTYRLICSDFSNSFYSQTEFSLNEFVKTPGVKIELSRACIEKKHRTGAVMNLLWRGIAQLLRLSEADYLFGCTSVRTMDLHEAACVYQYLSRTESISSDLNISPLKKYEMPGLQDYASKLSQTSVNDEVALSLIPPLFRSYLRMGAKGFGLPALDKDFGCIDFLTILPVDNIRSLYERKYLV